MFDDHLTSHCIELNLIDKLFITVMIGLLSDIIFDVYRYDAPQILFVITDGKSGSTSNTISAAQALLNEGVTVFAIGVGNANAAELNAMASKPEYVYRYTDYDQLAAVQDTLRKETCKGKSFHVGVQIK